MTANVEVICAWCYGPASVSGDAVSHGICVDCAIELLRKLPREFLDSIADPDGTVDLFEGRRMNVASGKAC
jgi:hypothetical protein